MKLNSIRRNGNFILLLLLAIVTPAIIGFQYLEWHDANHLFIGINGPIWTISYSDWYLNDWLIAFFPNIILLIPRLLFAFALIGFNRDKVGRDFVCIFGLLLVGIMIIFCVEMMTINSIFGIPPGVLISIAAPDIETRLFLPTPILLLVGIHQICKKQRRKFQEKEMAGQEGFDRLEGFSKIWIIQWKPDS